MDYYIPFIIDKNKNEVKSLADDYSMLEALRIISDQKNNGFFGLGNKEDISSLGMIYLPFYLMRYNDSGGSLVFYDDIFANRFSISLPLVLLENSDNSCEKIINLSAPYDLIEQVNIIINSYFNKIAERHDTFYTVARKDIVDCLDKYRNNINKIEDPKFVISDCKNSERYEEICRIYGIMAKENNKYNSLETNLGKLIVAVNQKKDELLKKTCEQRSEAYRQHSEKIYPFEKKFNEEIHPTLLKELNEGKDPIEKELNDLYKKYKEDIIPRLISERDADLSAFQPRIDRIKTDFEWQIKSIESERDSHISNLVSEKRLYESKGCVSSGMSYDAEITSYNVMISNYKKAIEQYEDLIDKLKKTEHDTSNKQREFYGEIRKLEKDIDKCKREISNQESEKRNKTKQKKTEYDLKLSSFDTKISNAKKDYNSRISIKRSSMEEQIRNIENERDSKKSIYDGKIEEQENIYSSEKSKLIYSRDQIQLKYERAIDEEKSKFEPMKNEREEEDKFYEKAITGLNEVYEKFDKLASEYLDNITEEFDKITEFFGMSLDFIGDEEYSRIIRLLVPVYIAEIQNKNKTNRVVILPPLVYKNGECNYGPKDLIEGQLILHQKIKSKLQNHFDENDDIRNATITYIRKNSILNKTEKNILKLRVTLEKMKKEEKIQEKEYKKLLKIISSL